MSCTLGLRRIRRRRARAALLGSSAASAASQQRDQRATSRASRDHHFAEHARFHVIEQVAVIRPATQRVRRHEIGEALRRAARPPCACAPGIRRARPRVSLHMPCRWIGCVIMVSFTSTMRSRSPCVKSQRLRVGELLAVERPDEAFHVAGQMQLDLAAGVARSIGPPSVCRSA